MARIDAILEVLVRNFPTTPRLTLLWVVDEIFDALDATESYSGPVCDCETCTLLNTGGLR